MTDAGGRRWILRRPPLGEHPGGAHDVLREARLLGALAGRVPVPGVMTVCDDNAVTGAPFVVLEFLDGLVVRDPEGVRTGLTTAERASVGPALIDAMVALHAVDPGLLGLGGVAGRTDYLQRQLRRWEANWRRTATRELADLASAHAILADRAPQQRRAAIVHGDYRLDNCLLARTGGAVTVLGILDWELTTVGDPLADLGQFLVYWAEPGDDHTALHSPPTAEPGFSSRSDLLHRYCAATGDDPAALDFYLAFNWWKTACIVEGVYSRMRDGSTGITDRTPESFADQAAALAAQALQHAARLG